MSRLARLSLCTTVLTFMLAAAGGLVRATHSGLGCPGWPKCYGRWIPPADHHAWIEMTHRYLAFFVSCGVMATCALALVAARRDRKAAALGVLLVPLIAAQAALGAYVVNRELEAWTVVAHLGLGMAFAAALIALTVHLVVHPAESKATGGGLLALTAAAVYGQLLLGSYVTGRGAGLAFPDFPLHDGRVVPDHLDQAAPVLQAGHRLWAYAVAALIVIAARHTRRHLGPASGAARWASVAAILVGLQIVLGAFNVWTRLHAAVVTAHLAVATLIWGSVWTAFLLARRTAAADQETDAMTVATARGRHAEPVLEAAS